MSDTDATPVISSETTSGITVMRMLLTQSVPIGAIASAVRISEAFCAAAMTTPSLGADFDAVFAARRFRSVARGQCLARRGGKRAHELLRKPVTA